MTRSVCVAGLRFKEAGNPHGIEVLVGMGQGTVLRLGQPICSHCTDSFWCVGHHPESVPPNTPLTHQPVSSTCAESVSMSVIGELTVLPTLDTMVTVGAAAAGEQRLCGASLESKLTKVFWWAGAGGLPVRITLLPGWIVSGKKQPLQPEPAQSCRVRPLPQPKPVGEIVPP